jgi:dinuclear metal center protein, YbgI/SA1388 family
MKTLEIYTELRKNIPADLAAGWDNEGVMLLSNPDRDIKRVLITLDVTPEAVDTAVKKDCGLIISHHPVIFKPLKRLDSLKLTTLIKADISVLSFHTSLDCADGGTADTLAVLLKLKNLTKLYDQDIPCARLGEFENQPDGKTLSNIIISATHTDNLYRVAYTDDKLYKRIAVCPGEGKTLYPAAFSSGADAYICGSMPYNDLCDASENNMTVFTAGHFHTEQPVCAKLSNLLRALSLETEIFWSNPVETYKQAEHSHEEN